MNLRKKHIIPLFLIWVFLTPTVVRYVHIYVHQHKYEECDEKHFAEHHEKCLIGDFHFSNFTSTHKYFKDEVKEVYRRVVYSYKTVFVEKLYYFSLLLRGPPLANDLV